MIGQHGREIIDGGESFPPHFRGIGRRYRKGLHAEGRFLDLFSRHVGLRPLAEHDEQIADTHLVSGNDGAVNLELVCLRRKREAFADLDLRNDKAVLQREFPAHLANAIGDLLRRTQHLLRELLANDQLNLVCFERFLNGVAGFVAGAAFNRPRLACLDLPAGLGPTRYEISKAREAARKHGERDHRQAGHESHDQHKSACHLLRREGPLPAKR